MRSWIIPLLAAVLASGSATAPAAELPAGASMCNRLAAKVRQLPIDAWRSVDETQALRPWLSLEDAPEPPPAALQADELAEVKAIQTVEAGPVFEHLPGTDVYMAVTIGGTAHCEEAVFIEAGAGRRARVFAKPERFGASGLCWNVHGDLARVFGQPAYVEHGTVNGHSQDIDIRITPWSGGTWGISCKLGLRFTSLFERLFALTLQGRSYVGAVGHAGFGWRESERTLFAVYAVHERQLAPLAGMVIVQTIGALNRVVVENDASSASPARD